MNRTFTFGIVGGYGATGRVVVSELWKSCEGMILIGGRDLAKGTALAKELDNRVSAAHLDGLDGRSLGEFYSQCSIIGFSQTVTTHHFFVRRDSGRGQQLH